MKKRELTLEEKVAKLTDEIDDYQIRIGNANKCLNDLIEDVLGLCQQLLDVSDLLVFEVEKKEGIK